MTSIAFDGKILAVDSRVTSDHIVTDNATKIRCLRDYNIHIYGDKALAIALAGRMNIMTAYVESLINDTTKELSSLEASLGGLIIGQNAAYVFEDATTHYCVYPLSEKIAVGSGALFAKSAMLLGKDAREAVAHAITLDHCSGGLVRWLNPFEGN